MSKVTKNELAEFFENFPSLSSLTEGYAVKELKKILIPSRKKCSASTASNDAQTILKIKIVSKTKFYNVERFFMEA